MSNLILHALTRGDGVKFGGLGWSIVRRIAQAHAADVGVAHSPSLGGLAVTVRWPVPASRRASAARQP